MGTDRYQRHDVSQEIRADGSILLTSNLPLTDVADRTIDWLENWAVATPDAVMIAERSGDGWREVTYAQGLEMVRGLAEGLLAQGMGADTPILIISGNSVNHALLTLAAQYIGVPTVPVAEQYALIPAARVQFDHIQSLIQPGLIYAEDQRFFDALDLPLFDNAKKLVTNGDYPGALRFEQLLRGDKSADIASALAKVGPDTVAKILMTSGSTSSPKGVLTTHRMMCTNQAQLRVQLPFLKARAPRIVDWLPWNHVFGGSHNFNMMIANGGALYVDNGKPVPALVGHTIENIGMVAGTLAFNVPVGFAMLRDALKQDKKLRETYFSEMDMLFYAGASLPQDVWADLEAMAREVSGEMPLFTSSWGLTETAPACLIQHEPTDRSGIVGVPVPGVSVKLIPDEDNRCEIRVKGPTITTGYYKDPEKTAQAFDEEGYFETGDAMKFVVEGDIQKGLKFDGRISEDFKLLTGTWVRAANLRLELLAQMGPLAQDIIITGADRSQIGLMIVPSPALRERADAVDDNGALVIPSAEDEIRTYLSATAANGSAAKVWRALVLTEPPSMADGEITAKGNLNFRKLLIRRSDLLERLYSNDDHAVIEI